MHKRFKKSVWLPFILFIYITAMAFYFLPRNQEMGLIEKFVTVGVSYIIVILLWWVLRAKERIAQKRIDDIKKTENN